MAEDMESTDSDFDPETDMTDEPETMEEAPAATASEKVMKAETAEVGSKPKIIDWNPSNKIVTVKTPNGAVRELNAAQLNPDFFSRNNIALPESMKNELGWKTEQGANVPQIEGMSNIDNIKLKNQQISPQGQDVQGAPAEQSPIYSGTTSAQQAGQPQLRQTSVPGMDSLLSTQAKQLSAIDKLTEAQVKGEEQKNKLLNESVSLMERQRADFVRQQKEIQEKKAEALNEYKAFSEKMSGFKVDPNRYMASKSTGQKIMLAIGAGLAGIGGGANPVINMIQEGINNDIQAQKDNFNKQGSQAQNAYSMAMAQYGDQEKAFAATQNFMLESSLKEIGIKAQQAQSPEIQARANLMAEQMKGQIQQNMILLTQPSGYQTAGAYVEKPKDKEQAERFVGPLRQLAATAKDAEEINTTLQASKAVKDSVQELRDFMDKEGSSLLPDFMHPKNTAKGDKLVDALKTRLAELKKMKLSPRSMKVLDEMADINPTSFREGVQLAKLAEIEKEAEYAAENTVKMKGLKYTPSYDIGSKPRE